MLIIFFRDLRGFITKLTSELVHLKGFVPASAMMAVCLLSLFFELKPDDDAVFV